MDANEAKILSLDELTEMFPRRWLAVEVVERDSESGQPLKARLLQNNVDLYAVRMNIRESEFCTLYTGPIPEVKHVGMF